MSSSVSVFSGFVRTTNNETSDKTNKLTTELSVIFIVYTKLKLLLLDSETLSKENLQYQHQYQHQSNGIDKQ